MRLNRPDDTRSRGTPMQLWEPTFQILDAGRGLDGTHSATNSLSFSTGGDPARPSLEAPRPASPNIAYRVPQVLKTNLRAGPSTPLLTLRSPPLSSSPLPLQNNQRKPI